MFGDDPARIVAFVCECGEDDCRRTVALTVEQYAARRPGPVLDPVHEPAAP